jgi:protein-tyrosine-phosphatase
VSSRPVVYFLCTGNAARSVMAAVMLRDLTESFEVRGAGTHVIEGRPMSVRTRRALERHNLSDPHHRSHQMAGADVQAADLVIAMEPMHVEWIRRHHPQGSPLTGTLRRLVRDLGSSGVGARGQGFASRITALDLDRIDAEPWETVDDPASGDQEVFDRCADELMELVAALHQSLR